MLYEKQRKTIKALQLKLFEVHNKRKTIKLQKQT